MNKEDLEGLISKLTKQDLQRALSVMLAPHSSPVFGAVKIVEHEMAAIEVLKLIGYLNKGSDEYSFVEKLRVTKAKAKSLMYQEALRKNTNADDDLRGILSSPTIQKDTKGMFLIEVPYPLQMDRLRSRVRELGFISNGSFSGSTARISANALEALIESLIPNDKKDVILKKLKKQGFPDKSIKGLLRAFLLKAGSKVADGTGEQIVTNIGEVIGQTFNGWYGSDFFW